MINKELIEKINSEYIEIKNSQEFRVGRKILNLKKSIMNFDILTIFKALKFHFTSRKIPKKTTESFSYSVGEATDAKGVVYTCITGNYDLPKEPLYDDYYLDYVLFTDNINSNSLSKWIQKPITDFNFTGSGNLVNRYCKMNPFALFDGEYDYAVYIDGSVQIISCVSDLYSIAKKSKVGIAMHRHYERDCIYDEAVACALYNRGNKEKIKQQMNQYQKEGFPKKFGLYEATIIIVDLHNNIAKSIFQQWWNEYLKTQSMRDQLSIPYIIWKNKYNFSDIGDLGNNLYKNPKFRIYLHE